MIFNPDDIDAVAAQQDSVKQAKREAATLAANEHRQQIALAKQFVAEAAVHFYSWATRNGAPTNWTERPWERRERKKGRRGWVIFEIIADLGGTDPRSDPTYAKIVVLDNGTPYYTRTHGVDDLLEIIRRGFASTQSSFSIAQSREVLEQGIKDKIAEFSRLAGIRFSAD